jgi:hypothetical protein
MGKGRELIVLVLAPLKRGGANQLLCSVEGSGRLTMVEKAVHSVPVLTEARSADFLVPRARASNTVREK